MKFRHNAGGLTWSHRENGQVTYRTIAGEVLGRDLTSAEEVHHIDGNHFNNNPENLIVLTKSEHSKIHASRKERGENGRFVKARANA